MRLPGIGSHHSARRLSDEWLTPPDLVERLGPFDLDPCAPEGPPWLPIPCTYTIVDDGLARDWRGRVWLNPPYSEVETWMARMARYPRGGTALVFARTETRWWFESVWPVASALLFLRGRLTFYEGATRRRSKAGHNSGGPSVLVAYGDADATRLYEAADLGAYVRLRR